MKKNKNKIIIGFCVIVLLLGLLLMINPFGSKTKSNKAKGKEKELTDKAAIEKLDYLIKVLSYKDSYGNGFGDIFFVGKEEIDSNQKINIAYYSAILINDKAKKVTKLDDKYKDDYYLNSLDLSELSIDEFKNEYKKLFNEDIDLNDSNAFSIYMCPRVVKYDKDANKLYISNECVSMYNDKYYYKNYKYTSDNDYYYVYQYIGVQTDGKYYKTKSHEEVNVNAFEGNEEKFEKIVWRFDKKYNFASTMDIIEIEEEQEDNKM